MKKTISEACYKELKELGIKVVVDGTGDVSIEELRENPHPKDFEIENESRSKMIVEWSDFYGAYQIRMGNKRILLESEQIAKLFFNMVKACKGTEHEWKGSEKIADDIALQSAANMEELKEKVIIIIEKGGINHE